VIGFSRSLSDLEHENYVHCLGDVSIESDIKNAISIAKSTFGNIDILINNAGIASMNHTLLTPSETVKNLIMTNFLGSFIFSRECAKMMVKNKWGRIINFSTVAVPLNLEGELAYASSKTAVEKMTKILSKEIGSKNITVNCIGPTPIPTDLIKTVPKNKIEEIISQQSIKRLGALEDVKNVIDFYISKKSDFITGQKIYLGGL
jgi:3-oxoacyl-[acyl-carrier protein] reductase